MSTLNNDRIVLLPPTLMMSSSASLILSRTVALVTGGSSGLGSATVKYLVENGARVVTADLHPEPIQPPTHNMRYDGRVIFSTTDVTKEDDVRAALDLAESNFGEPINAAVSCAGIAIAKKTLSKKGPHGLADFTKVLMVNTVGSFNVARLAAERMSHREADEDGLRGCIINTASIAAYEGQIGQVAYAASKGGVVGMTLPMARDLAPNGIRVMTIVS